MQSLSGQEFIVIKRTGINHSSSKMPKHIRPLNVCEYEFKFVAQIEPERDATGEVAEEMPQSKYKNEKRLPLHAYGKGSFCRFRLSDLNTDAGVYVITSDRATKYVGMCQNLAERFGPKGYAVIHPRNCFVGGQQTNCRINKLIMETAKAGHRIGLWFQNEHEFDKRNRLEQDLRDNLRPEWNLQ